MEILGVLIMQMIQSHECTDPHEQVALITLKQVIYNKSMKFREFDEYNVKLVQTRLDAEK